MYRIAVPEIRPLRRLPIYSVAVSAGSPEPIEEYVEGEIDLNEELIRNPDNTFGIRVKGDSMIDAGIRPGDLLIVDRSLEPSSGKVVIVVVDGELTIKRLARVGARLWLMPANPTIPPKELANTQAVHVWGVVTHCIHEF